MRYFVVTVHPKRVEIKEVVKEFTMYDCLAIVDGDHWRYKIKKHENIAKNDRIWRGRAYHNIQYHATNSGEYVRFQEVHFQHSKKRKINEKQLYLL